VRTTGLYHVAIRYPGRQVLAQAFQRLVAHRWPFQGFSDHGVSEALYLADPDGNGLELYVDRAREHWAYRDGQIAMTTEPLDVEGLLAKARTDPATWTGLHPETDIGHVHLHVSDLAEAEAFYHGLLGLDVTQRGYPGALFLSAGGYHHHLGINTWAGVGAPPPPPDAVGLICFSLYVPDQISWQGLLDRVQEAGMQVEGGEHDNQMGIVRIQDPDRNNVALATSRANLQNKGV
jgi:catechol 2,3-dioxygenase